MCLTLEMSSQRTTFTIGTRKSKLALLQTDLVRGALQEVWPHCEFKILTRDAAGDLNKTTPLREFSTKNLWTEELEEYLTAGQIDLVVHSLKGIRFSISCRPRYATPFMERLCCLLTSRFSFFL